MLTLASAEFKGLIAQSAALRGTRQFEDLQIGVYSVIAIAPSKGKSTPFQSPSGTMALSYPPD